MDELTFAGKWLLIVVSHPSEAYLAPRGWLSEVGRELQVNKPWVTGKTGSQYKRSEVGVVNTRK